MSLRLLSSFAFALVAASCTSGPPPPDEAVQLQDIATHRVEKERFLREDKESPIPADKRRFLAPQPGGARGAIVRGGASFPICTRLSSGSQL